MSRWLIGLGALLILLTKAQEGYAQFERSVEINVQPLPFVVPVQDTVRYASLQQALVHGQLDYPRRQDLTPPVSIAALIVALEDVLAGKLDTALEKFEQLSYVEDESLSGLAIGAMSKLLFERGAWPELQALLISVGADVPPFVQMLSERASPEWTYTAETSLDSLHLSIRGHIFLRCQIGEHEEDIVFDTGAAFTVLSEAVANRAGVHIIGPEAVEVTTATANNAQASLGLVPELTIGQVTVRNYPVLVFPDANLTFTTEAGDTLFLPGILGWDMIRRNIAELDIPNRRYTFRSSMDSPFPERPAQTLTWFGYPIVRTQTPTGQPLLFGLDTGSSNTSITPSLFGKVDVGTIAQDSVRIAGVGSNTIVATQIAEEFRVALSGYTFDVRGAWTEDHSGAEELFFFQADGVLGIDIAAGCLVEVDPSRARFALDCEEHAPIAQANRVESSVAFHPNGTEVAYAYRTEAGPMLVRQSIIRDSVTPLSHNGTVYDWSSDASSLVLLVPQDSTSDIVSLNLDSGLGTNLTQTPEQEMMASWMPGTHEILFVRVVNGKEQIFRKDTESGVETQLSDGTYIDFYPHYAASTGRIVFTSHRDNNYDIYSMKVDGTDVQRLTTDPAPDYNARWSPDAQRLVFVSNRDGDSEIYVMAPDGSGLVQLTYNEARDNNPRWSPDGRYLALISRRDGVPDIYLLDAKSGTEIARLTWQ